MMRQILSIIAFAVFGSGGVILAPGPIHAQGNDNDYVDVGVTLEVPHHIDLYSNIIVVNRGSRTAYDVEVVVGIESPGSSYFRDTQVNPPIGGSYLASNGSLLWSIPALEGGRREEYRVNVVNASGDPVFDNSRHPHEFFGRVTTSSFESGLHQGNNTSRVWSYASTPAGRQWQAAGNYSVVVSVDDPYPAPGDIVNFTVTTDREERHEDYLEAPPIDMEVAIELTGGLSVSGDPTHASGFEGDLTVPDSVSYSNGVFSVGTLTGPTLLERGDPIQNSVTLPVTVANNAVVNEQCLTATLTGNPPPGTGRYDDDILDNVAKVCLGGAEPLVSGQIDAFTVYPCVGITDAPCDSTEDIKVRAVTASGTPLIPGTALFYIDPLAARRYDAKTGHSVNDGNTVSWQTSVTTGRPYAGLRNGVELYYSRTPYTGNTSGWRGLTFGISARNVDGNTPPPGKVFLRSTSTGNEIRRAESPDYQELRTAPTGNSTPTTKLNYFLEFEKLGTYKFTWHAVAKRSSLHGSENCNPDNSNVNQVFCASETYTFHVGPMADLTVEDGGASYHAAADQHALTIVPVNNGPDHSPGAQVTGLRSGMEVIHKSQGSYDSTTGEWDIGELKVRGYYRSRGEPEPTLVLSASAGDTTDVRIAAEDYEVCIGGKDNPGDLVHTTKEDCEADTATGVSWHSTPVYDYKPENNTATITAARGTGGIRSELPRSLPAAIVVQWADLETLNGLPVSHYEVERSASPGEIVADNVQCATEVELSCQYVDTPRRARSDLLLPGTGGERGQGEGAVVADHGLRRSAHCRRP